jgi:hypothetical protein
MKRLRGLSRGGRLLLALAVGGAVFGIASAVQASIPDANGVIHGCYNSGLAHGSPLGALRVIDTARIDGHCASWEAPLNWNAKGVTGATGATGPTGPTGPTGVAGPTSLDAGGGGLIGSATTLVAHTVTASEAGLTLSTATVNAIDADGTSGGVTILSCFTLVNGGGTGHSIALRDNGETGFRADQQSMTLLSRLTLAAGDVVSVRCDADAGDTNEAFANAQLMLEHVSS